MRQNILVFSIALFLPPSLVIAAEYLEEVESAVYQSSGTIKEISTKAKSCIAQTVRSDEGGQVIVDANLEEGIITANNLLNYNAKLLAHSVKSTMTLLVKDGRFKMRHSNIEYTIDNSAYQRVGKWMGTGWKDAEEALLGVSEKVAACINSDSKKDNW